MTLYRIDESKVGEEYRAVEIPEFFYTATAELDPVEFAAVWTAFFEKVFYGNDIVAKDDTMTSVFVKLTMHYYEKDSNNEGLQ